MKKFLGILFILTAYLNTLSAQEKLVDRVIATVGNAHILQSDLEIEYTQYLAYGNKPDDKVKCYILQQLLTQKLLAQQAAIDSIEVSESEIDDQLNYRIRTMIQRAGGKERLEVACIASRVGPGCLRVGVLPVEIDAVEVVSIVSAAQTLDKLGSHRV